MARKIHQIHDKFVKASFADPDRAIAFFERFLPENLKNVIQLQSLKVLQDPSIQSDLSEHFSDIVFEVKTVDDTNLDIVLLFEHKSKPDKFITIQLGHYIFSHWFKCISTKKALKIIVPIIYYQGIEKWQNPDIVSLFPKVNMPLELFIPKLQHIFIALNSLSDLQIEEIRNRLMVVAVLAQKSGLNPAKLADDLSRIFSLFPESEGNGNFLQQVFVYLISISEVNKDTLNKAVEHIPTNVKNNIMTTYEMIKQESKAEGKAEGKIEVILNGFDNNLSISLLTNITQLPEEDVLKILREYGKLKQ